MPKEFLQQLIRDSSCDLASPAQWSNARDFFLDVLHELERKLPAPVLTALQTAKDYQAGTATPEQLAQARAAAWKSMGKDSAGVTREGAAIRAALFPLCDDDAKDGPIDALTFFSSFALRAGVSQSILEAAFRKAWDRSNP